jgi:hypothetical protein
VVFADVASGPTCRAYVVVGPLPPDFLSPTELEHAPVRAPSSLRPEALLRRRRRATLPPLDVGKDEVTADLPPSSGRSYPTEGGEGRPATPSTGRRHSEEQARVPVTGSPSDDGKVC